MAEYKQLTVKELRTCLNRLVKEDFGDRKIIVANDSEGSAYHGLYYGAHPLEEDGDAADLILDLTTESEESVVEKLAVLG